MTQRAVGIREEAVVRPKTTATRLKGVWRVWRRKPLGLFGLIIVVTLVLVAIFANQVAPYDPIENDYLARLKAPSATHFFGTDNFGRDVFSRVVHGSRISLYVSILATVLGVSGAILLGVTSGYMMGKIDLLIQRLVDAAIAVPSLILALIMVAALGQSINNVVIAIAFSEIPRFSRVIRSVTIETRAQDFVDAARALGARTMRIMFRHVWPATIPITLVIASNALGSAILTETSLSFLGLGIPPPFPAWGRDLTGAARNYFNHAPWMAIFPGLAITLVVYGLALFGDALRDILDPRLRGSQGPRVR